MKLDMPHYMNSLSKRQKNVYCQEFGVIEKNKIKHLMS